MKKGFKWRILAVLSSLVLMAGLSAAPVSADLDVDGVNPNLAWPSNIRVDWSQAGKLVSGRLSNMEFVLTTQVNGRADCNLYLSFPSQGGFRLRTKPSGYFNPKSLNQITYRELAEGRSLIAGDTKVLIKESAGSWTLEAQNRSGKTVYRLSSNQIKFGYQGSELKKVKLEGSLGRDEVMYGLGERFNSFSQVGESVLLWNQEAYDDLMYKGGDKTRGYKNVPILHSTNGYTLFFNSTYAAQADIGKTNAGQYSLEFNGPKFDFYLWTNDPLENLADYTELTGRTIIPPKWALSYLAGGGGMVWNPDFESGVWNQWPAILDETLTGYERLGTPLQAMYAEGDHLIWDRPWHDAVTSHGIRTLNWYWSTMGWGDMQNLPYIQQYHPEVLYDVTAIPQVWLNDGYGNPDYYNAMNNHYIDFTHPMANEVLYGKFKDVWAWGCRGSMVDMADQVTENAIFHNGMTGDEMHNFYAYVYNKGYYDTLQRGVKEGLIDDGYILFSRSGCAGSQAFVGQFAGDHPSSFWGLKQALLGGITAGTAGFSIWGSDIGGYGVRNEVLTPDLYMRWFQFAGFSPLMRAHGSTYDRNPWSYGDLAEKMYVDLYWLRENLVNTIYSGTIASHNEGIPMIQAMALAFPNEKNLAAIDDQYMFCSDFLVAPVLEEGAYTRRVTFPQGQWVDLWTGQIIQGGRTLTVAAPQERIPVYLRAGTATQIQVAPSLELMDTMKDKSRTNALLVTAGNGNRTYWSDENTALRYRISSENGTMQIVPDKSSNLRVVYAYGVSASDVTVGGGKLNRLNAMPVNQVGYYVDPVLNRTVIRLPDRAWSQLTIRTETADRNLAAGKTVKASQEQGGHKASNMLDNDAASYWSSGTTSGNFVLDLGEKTEISGVSLAWTRNYAPNYTIQVGDGESWTDVHTEKQGLGDREIIRFAPVKTRYVRFTASGAKSKVELSDFGVYGAAKGASTGVDPGPGTDPRPGENPDPGDSTALPGDGTTVSDGTDVSGTENAETTEESSEDSQSATQAVGNPDVSDGSEENGSRNNSHAIIIGVGAGVLLLAGAGVAGVFFIKKRKADNGGDAE